MQTQTQTVPLTIGADVAKDEIVVACEEQHFAPHGIANRRSTLVAFLKTLPPGSRIGMESTGIYHELFATLAHQMGYSSEQPSSPKKQILGLKKENARLRENCKHLEGLVESARRWQSRSWIKRAFHKWRPSKRALKKPHAQGEPVAAESLAASPSPDEVSPGNGQQRAHN